MNLTPLHIKGISYSQTQTGAYALILQDIQSKKKLPIVIGAYEAQAIAISLEKDIQPSRPLTHDLFKSFAELHYIGLEEVIIYKLIDGVFFSNIVWRKGGEKIVQDARTSDAIALAVRFKAPIYTTLDIIERAGIFLEEESQKEKEENHSFEKEAIQLIEKSLSALDEDDLFSNSTLEELDAMLNKAIKEEDYELAAQLRDELDKRKK